MSIGSNLRKLRAKTKYSQRDMAEMIGVDKNTYANWESNITSVKADFIPKIAKVFRVSISELFNENHSSEKLIKENYVLMVFPSEESVDKFVEMFNTHIKLRDY